MVSDIKLHIQDGSIIEDKINNMVELERNEYLVKSPLFKRGKLWEAGEIIKLDPKTADGFISVGQVELVA